MSYIDDQRESIDKIISYLDKLKSYMEDPSQVPPSFYEEIQDFNVESLQGYLYKVMSNSPTYSESVAVEVVSFVHSWIRDLSIRDQNRASYFSDYSLSLDNDLIYLRGLKELQTQYLRGSTPQQRS